MPELAASARDALVAIDAALRGPLPMRGTHVGLELGESTGRDPDALCVGAVVGTPHGVWASVRVLDLLRDRGMEGSVYLMRAEDLADPRRDAYVAGWLAAIRRIVLQATAPATPFTLGALDQRMPLDVVPSAIPAKYEAAFAEPKWLGRFLSEKDRSPAGEPYERAPLSAVTRGDEVDLDALFSWVFRHAELGYEDPVSDLAAIEVLGEAPKTLVYLFTFENRVHNGGIASFVLQTSAFEIQGAHRALVAIGAARFKDLLERAVALAAHQENPQFSDRNDAYRRERNRNWRTEFVRDKSLSTTSDLDGHEDGKSFFLLESELRPKLRAYVERHREALLRNKGPRPGVVRRGRS